MAVPPFAPCQQSVDQRYAGAKGRGGLDSLPLGVVISIRKLDMSFRTGHMNPAAVK